MKLLILLGVLAVAIQLMIFVYGRRLRKKEKQENVLLKYNIRTRHDLWLKIADPEISEDDREKLKQLYNSDD